MPKAPSSFRFDRFGSGKSRPGAAAVIRRSHRPACKDTHKPRAKANLFAFCRGGVSSTKSKIIISRAQCQIYFRAAACGGRNDAEELRASAGRRLRPAAVPFRNRKCKIQDSKLNGFSGLAWVHISIRATASRSFGLSRSRADGRATSSARMQPSARERLRPAAAYQKPQIQDSKFNGLAGHAWAYM